MAGQEIPRMGTPDWIQQAEDANRRRRQPVIILSPEESETSTEDGEISRRYRRDFRHNFRGEEPLLTSSTTDDLSVVDMSLDTRSEATISDNNPAAENAMDQDMEDLADLTDRVLHTERTPRNPIRPGRLNLNFPPSGKMLA